MSLNLLTQCRYFSSRLPSRALRLLHQQWLPGCCRNEEQHLWESAGPEIPQANCLAPVLRGSMWVLAENEEFAWLLCAPVLLSPGTQPGVGWTVREGGGQQCQGWGHKGQLSTQPASLCRPHHLLEVLNFLTGAKGTLVRQAQQSLCCLCCACSVGKQQNESPELSILCLHWHWSTIKRCFQRKVQRQCTELKKKKARKCLKACL